MKRPKILLTNDDGIHAEGLKQLWHVLKDQADITIIAPTHEQSATGLSMTVRQPLRVDNVNWPGAKAYSVSGTPTDCVKLALSVVLDHTPDVIVSGINRGGNAGRTVLYSGTVGGAIEGTLRGIPSIAMSCWEYIKTDYTITNNYIPKIVQHVLQHALPAGTLLNVNFPPVRGDEIQGVKLTKQGKEYWIEDPEKRLHPADETPYYWMGIKAATFDEDQDCDITWLQKGYVTAVPVHISELTDHDHLGAHRANFEKLF